MIGYYVHHHGFGHRMRATAIALELHRLGHNVVGFGSMSSPEGWPGEWVELPMDTGPSPADPTANATLHWAPTNIAGHRERLAVMAVFASKLHSMVVDTSADIAIFARVLGIPTAIVAMRGTRRDRPHESAYDAAGLLIAPWPATSPEPSWPERWLTKTCHAGAISRFDHIRPTTTPRPRTVLLLWGAGGSPVPPTPHVPGWTWTVRAVGTKPTTDMWDDICSAEVVVTHGGQNAVAEVAAAGRPAIVNAQDRPFDEQYSTVAALREAGVCIALDEWPAPEQWPDLLDRASGDWDRWTTHSGAMTAAQAIADFTERAC